MSRILVRLFWLAACADLLTALGYLFANATDTGHFPQRAQNVWMDGVIVLSIGVLLLSYIMLSREQGQRRQTRGM